LYEAKLNKAKLERAEMSTDFTKERLELHKSLVEAKEHIEILLKREDNMMEQIDLYKQQATELHSALVIVLYCNSLLTKHVTLLLFLFNNAQ
jgi:hypothetical protein